MIHRAFLMLCLSGLLLSCQSTSKDKIDHTSYQLGIIAGFSELVGAGTKALALSEPMDTDEMDQIMEEVQAITDRHGIQWHRDPDLIVTDLFPADVAKDKEVLLLYKGHTLDAYQQLKADKKAMEDKGVYDVAERRKVARRFGRLLSYPPSRINELLAGNTDFRTMQDFGIKASNAFFYYKDLEKASDFYANTLGLEIVADYGVAKILRIASASYLTLVDATVGMHNEKEPKTVALALLTNQLSGWYTYLKAQNIPIKYEYKPKEGNSHDGFVAIDPEGYLLEFETFKQHPENEKFMPILDQAKTVFPIQESSKVPPGLGFNGSITWLYYKDLLQMQNFYEETIGFSLVADQGWTKIYQASPTGFLGLVDERRGMHSFTEDKAVNVSFFLDDVEGWYKYVEESQNFPLHSKHMSVGLESKYRSFVGYDPEGYFLEFNLFLPHDSNQRLLEYLQ